MPQNWYRIAESAEAEFARPMEYGSVMANTEAIASSLGTSRQALRNYTAALRFIRSVAEDDPETAAHLVEMPATMVALYSTWWRYDRTGAAEHVHKARSEGLPAREIIAAEKAARQVSGTQADNLLSEALSRMDTQDRRHGGRSGIVARAFEHLDIPPLALEDLTVAQTALPLAACAGVRQILEWRPEAVSRSRPWHEIGYFRSRGQAGPFEVVGVIEVPRGPVADSYRRTAKGTFARAALASSLYPIVLVLLPDREAVGEFTSALPSMPSRRLGLDGDAPPTGAYVLGSGLGTIIVAPADRLPEVWSGESPGPETAASTRATRTGTGGNRPGV